MSYVAERQAIQGRIAGEVESWDEPAPIAWPNVDGWHVPGGESLAEQPSGRAWLRVRITGGPEEQASVGAPEDLYRREGEVICEVFAPRGAGEREALEAAEKLAALFRGWRTSDLAFFAPRTTDPAVTDGWWKVDVIAAFEHDRRFAPATT